jgi:hypothetical protein
MILDVVSKAFDKIMEVVSKRVVDKDKQEEIRKELKLAANDIEKVHFEDINSARELSKAEVALSLKDPRSWVRPAWAFSALFMWVLQLGHKQWAFDWADYSVIFSVASFYFGSRFFEKRQKIKNIAENNVLGNWLK